MSRTAHLQVRHSQSVLIFSILNHPCSGGGGGEGTPIYGYTGMCRPTIGYGFSTCRFINRVWAFDFLQLQRIIFSKIFYRPSCRLTLCQTDKNDINVQACREEGTMGASAPPTGCVGPPVVDRRFKKKVK